MPDTPEPRAEGGAKSVPYPPLGFPTVFADAALNMAPQDGVVRFYLARLDPAMDGSLNSQFQPVIQVAMPVTGFLQMAVFFQAAIDEYVKRGIVSKTQLDELRAAQALKG